jgi:hypothetical protein
MYFMKALFLSFFAAVSPAPSDAATVLYPMQNMLTPDVKTESRTPREIMCDLRVYLPKSEIALEEDGQYWFHNPTGAASRGGLPLADMPDVSKRYIKRFEDDPGQMGFGAEYGRQIIEQEKIIMGLTHEMITAIDIHQTRVPVITPDCGPMLLSRNDNVMYKLTL